MEKRLQQEVLVGEKRTDALASATRLMILKSNWPVLLCTLLYLACILATTLPITQAATKLKPPAHVTSTTTTQSGSSTTSGKSIQQVTSAALTGRYIAHQITAFFEFALFLCCAFAAYGACALLIYRQSSQTQSRLFLLLIGLTTIIAGCFYLYTPATLSNDVFVYVSYGRLQIIHHSNPYFVPAAAFPLDPMYRLVYWKKYVSIYGPIWTLVCAGLAYTSGVVPLVIFENFRIFVGLCHLLNALLIGAILWRMGRSWRVITSGVLLYAWNPLVLLETFLGAHNDTFMVTFMLLGIYLLVGVEKKESTSAKFYIPAFIAFALAILVKFTVLPIVLFALLMLFYKKLAANSFSSRSPLSHLARWRSAAIAVMVAGGVCGAVILLFYAPYWLGHSVQAIVHTFSAQPATLFTFNSLAAATQIWGQQHSIPPLLMPLLNADVWRTIELVGMLCMLLVGWRSLRKAPTIGGVVMATLAILTIFCLTTNWFLPWYVTSLVALAAIGMWTLHGRTGYALIGCVLTFSFSALLTYYYNFIGAYDLSHQPASAGWITLAYLVAFSLPMLTFVILFTCGRMAPKKIM